MSNKVRGTDEPEWFFSRKERKKQELCLFKLKTTIQQKGSIAALAKQTLHVEVCKTKRVE